MIRIMKSTPETPPKNPIEPSEEFCRSLYFLSHADPSSRMLGASGVNLGEVAVELMEEEGFEVAPEYRARLTRRKKERVNELISQGTYASLSTAVHMAHEGKLGLDYLSRAWFARDDYAAQRDLVLNDDGLVDVSDAVWYLEEESQVTSQYLDKTELEIALTLCLEGVEGADQYILDRYRRRLELVYQATQDKGLSKTYFNLAEDLLPREHKELIASDRSPQEIQYGAYSMMLIALLTSDGLSDESGAALIKETVAFSESVIINTLERLSENPANAQLSVYLVNDLLALEPDNETYQAYRRKLRNYFRLQRYNVLGTDSGRFEARTALEALSVEPQLASHAIRFAQR